MVYLIDSSLKVLHNFELIIGLRFGLVSTIYTYKISMCDISIFVSYVITRCSAN